MRCVDEYHQFYEQARLWEHSYWFGIPMWKLPFDAMVIQELIYQIRPEYIIETGTGHGGSALFYAGICELLGEGKVITVDIDKKFEPEHVSQHNWADRITFLHGSSTNEIIFRDIEYLCKGKRNLVILDSWHSYDHVCKELELYEELVPVGSYLIVEDTHVSGHPVPWEHGKGPYEAVEWFLSTRDYFEPQYWCEKYIMTFNPKGYLKRIK
jgi:cephalosporin hydroxylase